MTYPKFSCAPLLAWIVVSGCTGAAQTSPEPVVAAPDPTSEAVPSTSEVTSEPAAPEPPATEKTILDLKDVTQNPKQYGWFNFKPNLDKLILVGAPETEHIALLWYTVPDGKVGLHYHAKTESVYAINGTQTDAKGTYPTGTVYFNPPGSGHQIKDSTGFFILAYASPPDFKSTDKIGEYVPVRIDTTSKELLTTYAFQEKVPGVKTYAVPLDGAGGMSSTLVALDGAGATLVYDGNYVLVLKGKCSIDGKALGEQALVVTKTTAPERFALSTAGAEPCLTMGLSFQPK